MRGRSKPAGFGLKYHFVKMTITLLCTSHQPLGDARHTRTHHDTIVRSNNTVCVAPVKLAMVWVVMVAHERGGDGRRRSATVGDGSGAIRPAWQPPCHIVAACRRQ